MVKKKKGADLKQYYTILFQIGLIITLGLMIAAFTIQFETKEVVQNVVEEQEIVEMEEVIQTKQIERPPPPPRPPVPVEVPNDEIIEDEVLDLDAELDLDQPIDVPPPPPPAEEKEEEEVFIIVEKEPKLIGGLGGLQSKINYPDIARKAGVEGRVIIQLIVNSEGEVENPRVVRGIGGGCDEEALRVIRTAKFTPGQQRGKPVNVRYTIPIVFQLSD